MQPLPDRLRPQTLTDFIGQDHLTAPGKLLHQLLNPIPNNSTVEQFNNLTIPSLILWGPPGTGKTTLARLIANHTHAEFHQLSAVSAGKKEIEEIINQVKANRNQNISPSLLTPQTPLTLLFLDEIHRFNKAQQDTLLPHVEDGTIILIGATTENPSFEVNSALLSRCRVLVLKPLEPEHIKIILTRALKHLNSESPLQEGPSAPLRRGVSISDPDLDFLAHAAHGDARIALNTLELAIQLSHPTDPTNPTHPIHLTKSLLTETLQSTHLRYDKKSDEHYNTISAFIKSMRASQPDAALYYLTRMLEAGEDPKFIARRMVIFASEDIGSANSNALLLANAVFRAVETIGLPEAAINLAHGVAYLSQSTKDRSIYSALQNAQADIKAHGNLPIPLEILNAPTKLMKEIGYGKNYEMYTTESLLPEKLKNKIYLQVDQTPK